MTTKCFSDSWKWNGKTEGKVDISRGKTENYWWIKVKRPKTNQLVRQRTKSTI